MVGFIIAKLLQNWPGSKMFKVYYVIIALPIFKI